MATTDPTLIPPVLEALSSEASFSVMHAEQRVAVGEVRSDVDVVVDRPPLPLLARLHVRLSRIGILQLTAWNYDIGAWTTVWTRDPSIGGMQLDLMYDPRGAGRYGMRTNELLRTSVAGDKYPTLGRDGQLAYLLQKRLRKGDWEAAQDLLDAWPPHIDLEPYWARSARLRRRDVEQRIRSRSLLGRRLQSELGARQVRRFLTRTVRRTGVLVNAASHDVREEIGLLTPFLIVPPRILNDMSSLRVQAELRRPTVLVATRAGGVRADGTIKAGPGQPFPLSSEINAVWGRRLTHPGAKR